LRSDEALELMAQALGQSPESPDTAVMTVSPSEGLFGVDRLAVLKSPTYASYVRGNARLGESDANRIDLHELATNEGLEAARSKVGAVIAVQLAHVLHLREEDINPTRPLGEVGLDSLMALELVMNLERCFGINIPLSGSSGSMTISEIADEIIAHVGLDREEAVVEKLAGQHHGEVDPAQREALKSMLAEDVLVPKRLLS
jgi:acyl carrier protein